MIKPIAGLAAAMLALATTATASDDPIASRQILMSANGAAAAAGAGMLRDTIPYDPVIARSMFRTMAATGMVFGDYFPEGSFDPERSKAAEAVWTDRAGFDKAVQEFYDLAAAAVEAAGREGPADLEAFRASAEPLLNTCRTCHETYQIPD